MAQQQKQPQQRIRLGDLLVEKKLISEAQLTAALQEQKKSGRKLGRVLVENGYVDENALLTLISSQLGVPYIDLASYQYQPELSKLVPETVARRNRVLLLEENKEGLLVAMADPTNIFAYDELVRILKKPFQTAVVKESDLITGIDKVYQHSDQIQTLATEIGEDLEENVFDIKALNRSAGQSEAPVVKLLETLFEDAIKMNASDIHIEPDHDVLRIRRRIDGVLQEQVMDEKRIASALISRLKLMAGIDISERRMPQDGRFNLKIRGTSVDVRLTTMPTSTGESVVMRLLDQSSGMLRLDRLGMEPELMERFRKAIHKPHGLLLVTGPTGSGKTTTLYAALNELNKPENKIITAEDPVEYQLPRINQVQINTKIGLDFATILRAILRQDPDIILVGEIRDQETAEIALRAAITGHLVLSTLHTNDAISTALRLVDMGIESFLVASAVHTIFAQRLVRKLCEKCKDEHKPTGSEQMWFKKVSSEQTDITKVYKGAGCNACNYTGYRGRVAVHELLDMDESLADALRQEDYSEFKRVALATDSYQPLLVGGLKLVNQGVTSLEEIIRISGWTQE